VGAFDLIRPSNPVAGFATSGKILLSLLVLLLFSSSVHTQLDGLKKLARSLTDFEVLYRYETMSVLQVDDLAIEKIVAMDGFSMAGKPGGKSLTLRCDSAVVWIDPKSRFRSKERGIQQRPFYEDPDQEGRRLDFRSILGIYAEGDVHLQFENNVLRAERLLFDTVGNRILVVHGYVSSVMIQGKKKRADPPIPFFARAQELRIHLKKSLDGLSFSRAFTDMRGKNVSITSCSFGIPHYHVHAREIKVDPHEDEFMTVGITGATLNIHEIPVFYLPFLWGRTSFLKYFPLRSVSLGTNSRFGTFLYTKWGDEIRLKDRDGGKRKWGKWELRLDNRTRRGFGKGLTIDYGTMDYHGSVEGYHIRDDSTDLNQMRGFDPPHNDRGRFRSFHRQFLPAGLQLDVEGAWTSDRNFLYEYFERDARTRKAEENYVRLIRDWNNFSVRGIFRPRINDFYTRTEYLPRISGDVFSLPVVPDGFLGTNLFLDMDAEVTQARIRYDEILNFRDRSTNRGHVGALFELPVKIGPISINPFFAGQYTSWSETLADDGNDDRNAWTAGVRMHTQFWKIYEKGLFGMDVRHLVVPEVSYNNTYDVSLASDRIIPLDARDFVNEFEGITVRLQNKLQVKPGKNALDFFELNGEMVFYPEEDRDNNGRAEGPLFLDLKAGVPPVMVLADALFDWEEDDAVLANVGLFGDLGKIPGLKKSGVMFYAGHRFAKKMSSVFTTALRARLGEKWSLDGLYQYNYRKNTPLFQRYIVGRNFHRFRLEFEYYDDGGSGDHGFRLRFAPVEIFQRITRERWKEAMGQYRGAY